jgi:hypothetical protein
LSVPSAWFVWYLVRVQLWTCCGVACSSQFVSKH